MLSDLQEHCSLLSLSSFNYSISFLHTCLHCTLVMFVVANCGHQKDKKHQWQKMVEASVFNCLCKAFPLERYNEVDCAIFYFRHVAKIFCWYPSSSFKCTPWPPPPRVTKNLYLSCGGKKKICLQYVHLISQYFKAKLDKLLGPMLSRLL